MNSEHVIGILKMWAVIRGTAVYHQFETQESFEDAVRAIWSLVNISQSNFLIPDRPTRSYHTSSFTQHAQEEKETKMDTE